MLDVFNKHILLILGKSLSLRDTLEYWLTRLRYRRAWFQEMHTWQWHQSFWRNISASKIITRL